MVMSIPENRSLKGKRRVVRSVLDRVRHRFNAAVAEVDALDNPRQAVLGVAVVSNESQHVHAMLNEVVDMVEMSESGGILIDRADELVPMGTVHGVMS